MTSLNIKSTMSLLSIIEHSSLGEKTKRSIQELILEDLAPAPKNNLQPNSLAPLVGHAEAPSFNKPPLAVILSDRIKALGFEVNASTLNRAAKACKEDYLIAHGRLPQKERNGRYVDYKSNKGSGTYVYTEADIPLLDHAIIGALAVA